MDGRAPKSVWDTEGRSVVQTRVGIAPQGQTLASCDGCIQCGDGSILSQHDDDNVEHPVGYYSRKLIDSETRWSIWELELGEFGHPPSVDRIFEVCTSSW